MAKKKPLITYIMPVYNEEVDIVESSKSILAQKGKKEVIVINDGSTDHTGEVLATFGKKIKVITNETRQGAAKCRNAALKASTGDIIAVCDADIYTPLRQQAITEYFMKNDDMDVFYSAATCYNAANPEDQWVHPLLDWDFESKCVISHPTVAYRREAALAHPYHEDTPESDLFEFMLIDMYKAGLNFGGVKESLMYKKEFSRGRDKSKSNEVKKNKYEEYGISVNAESFTSK
jgi:glycosyltransferase involved in cell wall biosynthesis